MKRQVLLTTLASLLTILLVTRLCLLLETGSSRSNQNTGSTRSNQEEAEPTMSKTPTLTNLSTLKERCGPLCHFDKPIILDEGDFMGRVTAKVNCSSLFTLEDATPAPGGEPLALAELSHSMVSLFNHNNTVQIEDWYLNDASVGVKSQQQYVFSREWVEKYVEAWRGGTVYDAYIGASEEMDLAAAQVGVAGKRILVIGSQWPWLEFLLLAREPKEIVTLEYGNFQSEHPAWSFIRPQEFRTRYQDGSLPLFDLIFTFSSVEHSGLGRYGDPLNPWGDIITIAQAWCASTPEARLVLGVPTDVLRKDGSPGEDTISFNAHRVYGPKLYPNLVTNWRFVWPGPGKRETPLSGEKWLHQPVFIFSKINTE